MNTSTYLHFVFITPGYECYIIYEHLRVFPGYADSMTFAVLGASDKKSCR